MKSTISNMLLSLTGICVVMGTLLALVHSATEAPIAEAAARARVEALQGVLPDFDNDAVATAWSLVLEGDERPVTVYTGLQGGALSGVAVESWTMDGFSGEIDVMVGFAADGSVSGYKVLSSAETPGLGAKADDWFRDPAASRSVIGTFSPLSVSKDPGGTVDGITAATITSRAFLDAINRARRAFETIKNTK